jgi:hypothetical protein
VPEVDAPQEIRCECPRRPLLARAGIDQGAPFLWIRHMKGARSLLNMKVFGGRVEIVCRECNRVWRIRLGDLMEITKPQ